MNKVMHFTVRPAHNGVLPESDKPLRTGIKCRTGINHRSATSLGTVTVLPAAWVLFLNVYDSFTHSGIMTVLHILGFNDV